MNDFECKCMNKSKKYDPMYIAMDAHIGQFRRDGVTPYTEHLRSVVMKVDGDVDARSVAWLHDILEDTNETVESLSEHGVEEHIVEAIELLTKKTGESYQDYLSKIKENPLAKKVKIADMLSNLEDDPTKKQVIKYCNGLIFLMT